MEKPGGMGLGMDCRVQALHHSPSGHEVGGGSSCAPFEGSGRICTAQRLTEQRSDLLSPFWRPKAEPLAFPGSSPTFCACSVFCC